jgi:hypothetical protein
VKIAYLDCFAGLSGDMLLGALLDAGLSLEDLTKKLSALHLPGFELNSQVVVKNGIRAIKAEVLVKDTATERHVPQILALIETSDLDQSIKVKATAIFSKLGEVEARIHDLPLESVHLHEVGGIDTIVDVTGTLLGIEMLGIQRLFASPLPMGRGFVRSAHGQLPLPAPATLALLEGIPIIGIDLNTELVTPTGAVLLATLVESFGPIPPMTLTKIGYGAGTKELPFPNVLRLLIGEQTSLDSATLESLALLETNIDDDNPEIYDYVMSQLFEAGALDVFITPIHMKKNRPAILLQVLSRLAHADALAAILLTETSTLGVRRQIVERRCLERTIRTVETPYGPVRVKIAVLPQGRSKVAPEYEDCRQLAKLTGAPIREIYLAAERVALSSSA